MTDTKAPTWQEPGLKRRGASTYSGHADYVANLKANPGKWALFKTLTYIPSGGVYDWLKAQGLEMTTRSDPRVGPNGKPEVRVYVRAPQPGGMTPVEPAPFPEPDQPGQPEPEQPEPDAQPPAF